MTAYEEQLLKAQEEDKIIFYDYLRYKKAAGWKTRFSEDDWIRPEVIKKARYDSNFLRNLPDYYYLGFPIKELLKTTYSNGKCSACAIALSLCFKSFEIITCNLKNYADYYNLNNSNNKTDKYDHTILLVNLCDRKVVIDTTFCFITDIVTYNNIFQMEDVNILLSNNIKDTNVYKYIEDIKRISLFFQKNKELGSEQINKIREFENLCKEYKNVDIRLQEFINEDLLSNSNSNTFKKWSMLLNNRLHNLKVKYPDKNLFSLEDDEFDLTLDNVSSYETTKKRNKKILENYYKQQSEIKDSKVKMLLKKIIKK